MDAVETAIRNALERGDAFDPSYRERVYNSAFAALERSIEARQDLPADAAERRRDHLKAKIRNIESEFVPAETQAADLDTGAAMAPLDAATVREPAVTQPIFSPLRQAAPEPSVQPPVRDPFFTPQPPPSPAATATEHDLDSLLTEDDLLLDDEIISPEPGPSTGPEFVPLGEKRDYHPLNERRGRARPRRGGWMVSFGAGLVAVIAAVAAIWWLVSGSDVLGVSSLNPPPAATGPAGGEGQGMAGEDANWIIVFTPSDPTRAIATGGARAEVVTHGDDTFLKISSAGADQPVSFQVGQGILEKLAGREAVFDIVARAENGQKTQIAVSCDLGSLGDCGRSRFEVGSTISDFLVRAQLGNGAPADGATISIVPDVTGGGKALEILRIRASVADGS